MGWRELMCWRRELVRSLATQAEARSNKTSPESWSKYNRDPWWQQQKQLHKKMRGY